MTASALAETRAARPRILMVSSQFHPAVGGYERAALRLSHELVRRGFDVTVVTERKKKEWPPREVTGGVLIVRLWCIPEPGVHGLSAGATLLAFLLFRGWRYDVWHVHQYGLPAAITRAAGFLLRRPVILKLTSSAGYGISQALQAARFGRAMAFLHRRMSAVVAISRETMEEVAAFGVPDDRVHFLPNGVDVGAFHPSQPVERSGLKEQLGLRQRKIVLYVGRLSSEKNPDGLLEAWRIAGKDLSPEWTLVVVGDGPMHGALVESARLLGIATTVLFAGQRDDVSSWLRAADIYVLTSHVEGLSNALLEAMACGLPVVATRVSGTTELLGESGAGEVVEIGDMEAFARALVFVAGREDLRAQMGKAARRIVEAKYSLAKTADGYEALYRELAPERG